jgi:large subunit ribosomal protein L21
MYSIIEAGGFQYKVKVGEIVRVPLKSEDVGSIVEFDKVLVVYNGADVQVGTPLVAGAAVSAEVLAHGRDKKVLVYKKRRRKRYERTRGHRQDFTEVVITAISSSTGKIVAEDKSLVRARARALAIAKLKEIGRGERLTRKEKVAQSAKAGE